MWSHAASTLVGPETTLIGFEKLADPRVWRLPCASQPLPDASIFGKTMPPVVWREPPLPELCCFPASSSCFRAVLDDAVELPSFRDEYAIGQRVEVRRHTMHTQMGDWQHGQVVSVTSTGVVVQVDGAPNETVWDDIRPVPEQQRPVPPEQTHAPLSPPSGGWTFVAGDDTPRVAQKPNRWELGIPWDARDADLVEQMRGILVGLIGLPGDLIVTSHWRRQVECTESPAAHDRACLRQPMWHCDYYAEPDFTFTAILYVRPAQPASRLPRSSS